MKHIQLLFLLLVLTGTSLAQENKHLTFKGIPIDGTIENFVKQLKTKGFEHIMTEGGVAVLVGDFASYKTCTLAVSTLSKKDLVNKVGIIFPEKERWSTLYGDYFFLKELLTEKYGKPEKSAEFFDSIIQPDDDKDRMYRVKSDNCKYLCEFRTETGSLKLSIEQIRGLSCFVSLVYKDKINTEIIRKNAIDDL